MSCFPSLRLFFEIQTMLLGFGLILFVSYEIWARKEVALTAKGFLTFAIFSLLLTFILPFAFSFVAAEDLLRPSVQVFSEMKKNAVLFVPTPVSGAAKFAPQVSFGMNPLRTIVGIYLLVVLFSLAKVVLSLIRLRRIFVASHPFRRQGRLIILYNEQVTVPFSFRTLSKYYVVLSREILADADLLRFALRHEVEHHRAGHTFWAFCFEALRVLFYPNPGIHIILRILSELQEFACDETVVGTPNVSSHAYGRCLFEVAQSTQGKMPLFAGTTSMASCISGTTLKRRIKMILQKRPKSNAVLLVAAFGTAVLLSTMAYASHSFIQERKLSMEEGMRFRDIASRSTEIPLAMNALVLRELNRYLGTVEGKKFLEGALQRMPQYQRMIDERIRQYRLSKDLIVVALGESGFQNIKGHPSAGIWQFVTQTARRYHLVVDSEVDERLDIEKETVAAMEYLRDLFVEFKDWRFALKGYNQGEVFVRKQIAKYNTLDPWKIELQEEGRDRYLAKMTALLIILKNPSLLE